MPAAYSPTFKRKAIRGLSNRGDQTLANYAETLGISAATLSKWRDDPSLTVTAPRKGVTLTPGPTPAEPSNGHSDAPAAGGATNGHPAHPEGKEAFVRVAPDLTAPEIIERARNGHATPGGYAVDTSTFNELTRLRAENAELRSLLKKLL
jgi:hypothetical protein